MEMFGSGDDHRLSASHLPDLPLFLICDYLGADRSHIQLDL
jgi:hypothetical protein